MTHGHATLFTSYWCVAQEIDVSENFRMFATISTLKHEVSHEIEGKVGIRPSNECFRIWYFAKMPNILYNLVSKKMVDMWKFVILSC